MKRYLSFIDWKANKSCFVDLSNTADVSIKTTKKSVVIEISNEYGSGLTHTNTWEEEDKERVEELFDKKLDDKFTAFMLLYITKKVRDFVADTTLKNKILEVEDESKEWKQYIKLALYKITSPKETSDKEETKE